MLICEIFRSLQGEGVHIGLPTTFIRLTGCNLECSWCDTEYAKEVGMDMNLQQIMDRVKELGENRICITGGEPLHQVETLALARELVIQGYDVSIETNGSYPITHYSNLTLDIVMDFKCPSSGMSDRMDMSNLDYLRERDQLKFVVKDETDVEHALSVLGGHKIDAQVIFTPVNGTDMKWLADRILEKDIDARVLPQLHKMIWGGERGH